MNRWIRNFLIATSVLPCLAFAAQEKAQQQPEPEPELVGIYVGGFGGWIFPYNVTVTQMGTVFLTEISEGPLNVTAKGTAPGKTKGFGGVHIGREWMKKITPSLRIAPTVEIEASFFANTAKKSHLVNPTDRLDALEFTDKFPMRIGSLLGNGLVEFNNDYISPYLGFGVGVGFVSIHNANSLQTNPAEPDVNHFNTESNDFQSLFATQAKAGLRYRFLKHYRLSAEYRFFYLTGSDFTLGAASYPDHAPTSPWTVKFSGLRYNAFSVGLDYIF